MPTSPEFGKLLTDAIYRIRSIEGRGKSVQIVQDELGYAIGRDSGGSSIEHWRKGNAPANHQEVEALLREIVRRTDLDRAWAERFLRSGHHPFPERVRDTLFPASQSPGVKPQRPTEQRGALERALIEGLSVGEEHPALPPFVAGPPILHPRAFFGRESVVRRVFDMLRHVPLQNSLVIGPRRSGKTSLLHYVRSVTRTPAAHLRPNQRNNWLNEPKHYRWVMVDFQDARMRRREGLLRYLCEQLEIPVPEPCTLDRFLDAVSAGLQQPTVLLFDEIGSALQHAPELDDDFWESLRSLGPQVGGKLGFVLASHVSPMELAHDSGHSSPFFNIFGYTATLGKWNDAEVRALVEHAPCAFEEEDIAWIIEHGRGWPIIIQTLCRERFHSLGSDEDWREEALRQIAAYEALP